MNEKRRKELNEIFQELHSIHGRLDDLQNEEEDAYNNLPDTIRDGERGEEMQEYIDGIERTKSDVEEAMDTISQFDFIEQI